VYYNNNPLKVTTGGIITRTQRRSSIAAATHTCCSWWAPIKYIQGFLNVVIGSHDIGTWERGSTCFVWNIPCHYYSTPKQPAQQHQKLAVAALSSESVKTDGLQDMVVIDAGIRMAGSCLFNCDPNKTKVVAHTQDTEVTGALHTLEEDLLSTAVGCLRLQVSIWKARVADRRRGSNVSCLPTNHDSRLACSKILGRDKATKSRAATPLVCRLTCMLSFSL
jgi:hypothetical protein